MRSGAVEPAQAEGEEAEGASVGAFEDVAVAMLEDEEALEQDEAGGELEDQEEAGHVGRVADAAVVPVEAGGLVVAEGLLLVHAVAVLVAADPVRGEVRDEQPGLVVTASPDGEDVEGAPAGLEEGAPVSPPAGAGAGCQVTDRAGAVVGGLDAGLALDAAEERP